MLYEVHSAAILAVNLFLVKYTKTREVKLEEIIGQDITTSIAGSLIDRTMRSHTPL